MKFEYPNTAKTEKVYPTTKSKLIIWRERIELNKSLNWINHKGLNKDGDSQKNRMINAKWAPKTKGPKEKVSLKENAALEISNQEIGNFVLNCVTYRLKWQVIIKKKQHRRARDYANGEKKRRESVTIKINYLGHKLNPKVDLKVSPCISSFPGTNIKEYQCNVKGY